MSDLISRKALFEEIKSLTVTVMGLRAGKGVLHEYAKQYRDTLLRIINEQPTIEAVPVVHGEWENVGDNEEDLCFRCTNCNTEFSCEINMRQFAKHCPNCGADMRKGGAE